MPQPHTGELVPSRKQLWTFDSNGNLIVAGNVYVGGVPDPTIPGPGQPLVPGTELGPAPAAGYEFLSVLEPSGDATGVTDQANILAAVNTFPRPHVVLGPGNFFITGDIVPDNNTWLQGSGIQTTTVLQGSLFSGSFMIAGTLNSTISDLTLKAPNGTISSNVQADGISISQANTSGFVAGVTLANINFTNPNGWCVNFTDTGASGAPVGCYFYNLTGNGSGGIQVLGANRTVGLTMLNCGVTASGTGTATDLDGLYIQDCFDLEILGNVPGFHNGTNNAIHLHGHVSNVRVIGPGEIGGNAPATGNGSCGILIEDGTNGHCTDIHFSHYTQQTADIGISLQGTCSDLFFDDFEINQNNTHGVVWNTSGTRIWFENTVLGNALNGQGATGTNYDLNVTGTGTGRVNNCEFASKITSSGTAGVQASVNIAAGQQVIFNGVGFTGANASSANWFTNLPSAVMLTSGGTFDYYAGQPSGLYLCAPTQYAPGSQTALTTTSATMSQVSSSVNTGSFTAPASGNVVVTASFVAQSSATGDAVAFGLALHGSTTMKGYSSQWKIEASEPNACSISFLVTGLAAGTSYNLDLMFCIVSAGTLTIYAFGQTSSAPTLGSGGFGAPVVMTVQAI